MRFLLFSWSSLIKMPKQSAAVALRRIYEGEGELELRISFKFLHSQCECYVESSAWVNYNSENMACSE